MRRQVVAVLCASILLVAGISDWPVLAQTSVCQLAPVFLMLRDLIGKDRMGDCTTAVIRSDAGDLNQPTTRGMLTFRPSDLVVAFSDGQTTWLYGPNGLESRPIGTRLAWEGTGTTIAAPAAAAAPPAPGFGTAASGVGTVPGYTGVAAAPVVYATPTPVVLSTLPIKIDGDDTATTKPFDLTGGEYAVAWEVERQRNKSSCYVGSRLRRHDDQNPGALVLLTTLNTANDRSASGEARLFGVLPGRYVFDVDTTGCNWKFTIKLPSE
jgi:hypothetical protein